MKKELIKKLHGLFEDYAKSVDGIEFWFARDLQKLLGYADWRNFQNVIEKAKTACHGADQRISDHFVDVNKMVEIGSEVQREIKDISLTRYGCYLVAQNGDPNKSEIAFAQTYFAIQTRKQELIEKRLAEIERVQARKELIGTEKELSGIIFERLRNERSFARIRSKGDQALFGGKTTQDMKKRLNVPQGRPLADFLPTITIKAKGFASEITNFNIKRDDLTSEPLISQVHVKSNEDVRKVLTDRNITPEELPPDEDAKKVERRLKSEKKKLMVRNSKRVK